MLNAALALHKAGVRPLPIIEGTKRPEIDWQGDAAVMPTEEQVRHQFRNGVWIGAQAGAVSGNLECLDFDDPACFEPWCDIVEAYGLGSVLAKCYVQRTPRGGYHVAYRVDGPVPGNQKLAFAYDEDGKRKASIETRGDGGQFLVYPSEGYKTVRGKWTTLPVLPASARGKFIEAARSFDRCPKRPYVTQGTGVKPPGSDYDARTSWDEVLGPYGWKVWHERGGVRYWTRPGKTEGVSATTGYAGTDLLYVFSSNAAPFEEGATYSKFAAFAFLQHGGNFVEAARDLGQRGYGDQDARPVQKPKPPQQHQPLPTGDDRPTQRWVTLDTVEVKKTDWLYEPYIPLGEVTLVAGDPGEGKSTLLQAIATAVTTGAELFGRQIPRGRVVFLSAEQSLSRVTTPRFREMGADLSMIVCPDDETEEGVKPFVLDAAGMEELRAQVVGSDVRLIVVDTVTAYIEGQRDFNTANSVREWMRKLADTARAQQCALVILAHCNKNTNAKPLYRIQGSIDFVGASRSVLMVGHDPDDDATKAFTHEKSNVGPKGSSVAFNLDGGEFKWIGPSDMTSEQMFAPAVSIEAKRTKKACADWLEALLKDGPMGSTEIMAAAKENGFSRNSVFAAKKAIGADAERDKFGSEGSWQWFMPKENVGKRWWGD